MYGEKSPGNLADEASGTAKTYLLRAVAAVNEIYGEGAALQHPELVVAMVNAASRDFQSTVLHVRVCDALNGLAEAIRSAGQDVRSGLE